jgi:hypothetical protein
MKRSVALLALVAMTAGCGGARPAPHFQAATGWHVLVEPGQAASAANVPLARGDRWQSFPSRTISSLPPHGVLIWIEWIRWRAAATLYPRKPLPLRVVQAMYTGGPEGTSCPRSSADCVLGHLSARESGWDTTIWIFSGAPRESSAQVATADTELARLRFG